MNVRTYKHFQNIIWIFNDFSLFLYYKQYIFNEKQNIIMKSKNILLWSKTDICAIIDCEVRVLPDIISEETKRLVGLVDTMQSKEKRKRYTIAHVQLILKDIYPFLKDEQLNRMILPKHLLTTIGHN